MVQVSRVRRGPSRDSIPFVLDEWHYASASRSWVRACWLTPAGDDVQLCCLLCGKSRFGVPGCVPGCLEWVRFVQFYVVSGPAGGYRLAWKVSKYFVDSTRSRCSSCTSTRRQGGRSLVTGEFGFCAELLTCSGVPAPSVGFSWFCLRAGVGASNDYDLHGVCESCMDG